jgi:hypothetical protein
MLRTPRQETSVMSSVPEKICSEVLHLAPREIQPVRPYLVRVVNDQHVLYVIR